MELLFGLIIVVIVASIIYFNRSSDGLDINKDGKVDVEDAKAAVENVKEGVKATVKKSRKPRQASAVKKTTRGKKTTKV